MIDHVLKVYAVMQKRTADYITSYALNPESVGGAKMYADDVEYNTRILKKFLTLQNFDVLKEDLIAQDTLVREWYYDVFKYMQDNNLLRQSAFR